MDSRSEVDDGVESVEVLRADVAEVDDETRSRASGPHRAPDRRSSRVSNPGDFVAGGDEIGVITLPRYPAWPVTRTLILPTRTRAGSPWRPARRVHLVLEGVHVPPEAVVGHGEQLALLDQAVERLEHSSSPGLSTSKMSERRTKNPPLMRTVERPIELEPLT